MMGFDNRKPQVFCGCMVFALASLFSIAAPSNAAPAQSHADTPSFMAVQAVLNANCITCHNDNRHPEAVNLTSYEKLLKSGEHGSIIVAGHPESSKLVRYIDGEKTPRMPFRRTPLKPSDIALIQAWIKAGAKP